MNELSADPVKCVECNSNNMSIPKYKLCKQCYDRMRRGKHAIKINEYYKAWYKERGKYQRKRKQKPMVCSICNFAASVPGQIKKHHKDGNHHNNTTENISYICANCHRAISYNEKHYQHESYAHLQGLNVGRTKF